MQLFSPKQLVILPPEGLLTQSSSIFDRFGDAMWKKNKGDGGYLIYVSESIWHNMTLDDNANFASGYIGEREHLLLMRYSTNETRTPERILQEQEGSYVQEIASHRCQAPMGSVLLVGPEDSRETRESYLKYCAYMDGSTSGLFTYLVCIDSVPSEVDNFVLELAPDLSTTRWSNVGKKKKAKHIGFDGEEEHIVLSSGLIAKRIPVNRLEGIRHAMSIWEL